VSRANQITIPIFPSHWRTRVFSALGTKMMAAGDVMPCRTAFTPNDSLAADERSRVSQRDIRKMCKTRSQEAIESPAWE
jgi:hypothetical protein